MLWIRNSAKCRFKPRCGGRRTFRRDTPTITEPTHRPHPATPRMMPRVYRGRLQASTSRATRQPPPTIIRLKMTTRIRTQLSCRAKSRCTGHRTFHPATPRITTRVHRGWFQAPTNPATRLRPPTMARLEMTTPIHPQLMCRAKSRRAGHRTSRPATPRITTRVHRGWFQAPTSPATRLRPPTMARLEMTTPIHPQLMCRAKSRRTGHRTFRPATPRITTRVHRGWFQAPTNPATRLRPPTMARLEMTTPIHPQLMCRAKSRRTGHRTFRPATPRITTRVHRGWFQAPTNPATRLRPPTMARLEMTTPIHPQLMCRAKSRRTGHRTFRRATPRITTRVQRGWFQAPTSPATRLRPPTMARLEMTPPIHPQLMCRAKSRRAGHRTSRPATPRIRIRMRRSPVSTSRPTHPRSPIMALLEPPIRIRMRPIWQAKPRCTGRPIPHRGTPRITTRFH